MYDEKPIAPPPPPEYPPYVSDRDLAIQLLSVAMNLLNRKYGLYNVGTELPPVPMRKEK